MIMETNAGHGGIKEKFNGLPGFRFHPTEQELVGFYLKRMVQGKLPNFNFIPTLELYRHEPWDLRNFASLGEREMFFFVPRDERCQNSRGRPNRLTATGYWKATGSDRSVHDDKAQCIGLKKTLVFYRGRARRGQKTDWLMNEYRLPEYFDNPKEVVLCRIYRKAAPLKWLEQQAMSCQEEVASSHSKSQHSLLFPAEFNDTKSIQDAMSICVRDPDSLACHETTTEPSSSPKDNVTKSDITGSLGCAVDSGFVDSTIDGEFIDWDFQVFADDYTRFSEFSGVITKLNFDV